MTIRNWRPNDFYGVSQEEQTQITQKSIDFYSKHFSHVTDLIKSAEGSYSPSGSDLFRPELWKPSHWRWFKSYLKVSGITVGGVK